MQILAVIPLMSFMANCFILFWFPRIQSKIPQHLIIIMSLVFNLEGFLSSVTLSITLMFLKSASQLFCRMFLSLGLSAVSTWIRIDT